MGLTVSGTVVQVRGISARRGLRWWWKSGRRYSENSECGRPQCLEGTPAHIWFITWTSMVLNSGISVEKPSSKELNSVTVRLPTADQNIFHLI